MATATHDTIICADCAGTGKREVRPTDIGCGTCGGSGRLGLMCQIGERVREGIGGREGIVIWSGAFHVQVQWDDGRTSHPAPDSLMYLGFPED